jgi:hypothetical protein
MPRTSIRTRSAPAVTALTRIRTPKYVTAARAIDGASRKTGFSLPSPPAASRDSRWPSRSSRAATMVEKTSVWPISSTNPETARRTSTRTSAGRMRPRTETTRFAAVASETFG